MSSNKVYKVLIITGPTNTGKTKLAVSLAKRFNGEIISADSRQVYLHLNIGTNKFSKGVKWVYNRKTNLWFADNIPIYLYDVITPDKQYSAFEFQKSAKFLIKTINKKNKLAIIVGGTGFYLRTLLEPAETITIPPNSNLRLILNRRSTNKLSEKLKRLDFERWRIIDKKNKRRLIRAIETSMFLKENTVKVKKKNNFKFETLIVGLTAPKEILINKAIEWVINVSEYKLIKETEKIVDKGYKNTPLMSGIIYKPTIDYINGMLNFENYQEKLYLQIKNYIRRQLTWFKKQAGIAWFDITYNNVEKRVEKIVETWLNKQ